MIGFAMKIALFDPSTSFRSLFKASIDHIVTGITWCEFTGLNGSAISCLADSVDAIVTATELDSGDYKGVIAHIKSSKFNKETPVFLFSSDASTAFLDKAFRAGVTDIFAKQDLMAVAETFKRMIAFSSSVIGAKVLLVEDDKVISDVYAQELNDLGFETFQAKSCEEAHTILEAETIELVITDLNLDDGGQGQRVIREIRHSKSVNEGGIPIMVMSGSAMAQHRICLFYLGIDEYVVKPVAPREVSLRAIHLIRKYRTETKAILSATRFKEIAHYDNLTGGYSRHGFLDIAHFYTAACKRNGNVLGILYLDLDNFKWVNDTHGHARGDSVLTLTVEILKSQLREQDVVSRWGGDEFVVLLQDCDKNYLECVAQRIQDEFKQQQDKLLGVGCSVGLSHGSPTSMAGLLELIGYADEAMYLSKKTKKGSVTVYSEPVSEKKAL